VGPEHPVVAFSSSLPPLTAKLEKLPSIPAKPKPKQKLKVKPVPQPEPKVKSAPQTSPAEELPPPDTEVTATSAVAAAPALAAASAPPVTETLAQPASENVVERPQLPHRAQLIFTVNKGTSDFKIGEVMHTLEIDNGHYVLQSVTKTVGLAKLFKTYKLTQYSSGSYSKQGLQPEQFFEERADKLGAERNAVEFDHTTQRARFSHGGEAELPPDTQDILSILYQFPPLANAEMVAINVSNTRKIERYEFEIAANTNLQTAMGKLRTVHLRKVHQPDEEGLEVWLALEYRLFPVKLRMIEKNGEISGEAIITEIHAEFEEEPNNDVNH
jgi:hypothetical protein